jgi:hypothetical protein
VINLKSSKMFSKILVSVAASASVVLAATPAGFEPGSQTSLLVTYGDIAALDGVVVAQESRSLVQMGI